MAVPITSPEAVVEVSARRRVTVHAVRRALASQLRQAEVQHLDDAVAADDDILRLDVSVHDAIGVRGRQRTRDLDRHMEDFGRRGRRPHSFPQGRAVDELCGDE